MPNAFSRTQLLLGRGGMEALSRARVAVFGVGGVGSYAAEALARAGVGHIALIDDDRVCVTNINRQLMATHSTIGRPKAEAMRERLLDINPAADVRAIQLFYDADTAGQINLSEFDYVIDAIDTVSSKLLLAERATGAQVKIISCMGAGNKVDPTRLQVADIYKTSVCPLARVMRAELRKRGIERYKVVYSKETPITPIEDEETSCKRDCACPPGSARSCATRRQVPGSVSFVPSAAGLILAGEVICDLAGQTINREEKP